jgi:predicted transcriptional regulator
LGWVYGLTERDKMAFQQLQQAEGGLTVDDVADKLDCERSTAYRSISRLHEASIIVQEQINYENGGYYYVYCPRAPEGVAHDMQRLLNDWYANTGQLIQEFENRYSQNSGDLEDRSPQSCS